MESIIDNLTKIADIFNKYIPDGIEKTIEIDDNIKCSLKRDKDYIKIQIETNDEGFDDSSTKEIVSNFKEAIKELDDEIFLEITDKLENEVEFKKFNSLLELEKFDENQAQEVEEIINVASDIIRKHLQHKIQSIVELYEKF